jgi:hypothetical protein
MDPAAVGASAALLGSLVGALASFGSSWASQRSESRRELRNRTLDYREKLYTEFINEAARRLTDALTHDLRELDALIPLYALESRIRLFSSVPVVDAAEKLLRHIVAQYGESNLSIDEVRSIELERPEQSLKNFSVACRQELEEIQRSR